jgi:hypothetical protein
VRLADNVFDVWTFRRDSDAVRFLLLYTSQTKAERYFNGGRFWQIPSNCIEEQEAVEEAVNRVLSRFGLTAEAIWAGEHAYIIYNRRFREMQIIGVYAAEVRDTVARIDPTEHSDYGWYTFEECLERVHYRGLKQGVQAVHEYITGVPDPAPELCLYQRSA